MEQYKDRDWLQREYWDKGLSMCKIAKICDAGKTTIFCWMKKFNMPRRNQNLFPKYLMNEATFENCDTPGKAYWIGFIMADGHSAKNMLRIQLKSEDKEHLRKFGEFLGSNVPIKEGWWNTISGRYRNATIQICRKKIVEDLGKYGIIPRKTGREQIKNIPEEYHSDFIRGYFDGDGSLLLNHRKGGKDSLCFYLACASRQFLRKIQNILIKNCNLSKTKIHKDRTCRCYRLIYHGNFQVPRIFDYLLQNSNTKLERKYRKLNYA